MLNKVIHLRDDDPDITLTTYVQDEGWKKRDAMLVLPGGAYTHLCADREGDAVALAYAARGVNAFVLKYSIREKAVFPRPLADASLAMAYIKDHAEEFHINPERVFCVGFSAGGHLAASLGTLWHLETLEELTGLPHGKNRPAGMILCYAALSAYVMKHRFMFHTILGTDSPTDEQLDAYSLEKQVSGLTVPTFLMNTSNDPVVPVENALMFAGALAKQGSQFELHIYPDGPHGLALGDWQTSRGNESMEDRNIARWVEDSIYWMENKVK
ncbi:MAG: alpha/beta hydrolase [Candidatus Flemingiibacterium sp.]